MEEDRMTKAEQEELEKKEQEKKNKKNKMYTIIGISVIVFLLILSIIQAIVLGITVHKMMKIDSFLGIGSAVGFVKETEKYQIMIFNQQAKMGELKNHLEQLDYDMFNIAKIHAERTKVEVEQAIQKITLEYVKKLAARKMPYNKIPEDARVMLETVVDDKVIEMYLK